MDLRSLTSRAAVRAARARIRALAADALREQLRIVSIPAPSLHEAERGSYLASRFRELGLLATHADEVGNVLAALPRGGAVEPEPGALLVLAHLDTVFPAGTPVEPRQVGSRVYAPGVTDNARGLAAMLAVARVLVECRVPTARPVWFVATVGEEGLGDLRGVKHLFRPDSPFARAAGVISLDGTGVRRVVHRAIGSRRLRAALTGPGGHSWSDFGAPNPIHALGAAVSSIRNIVLPDTPASALTVARCGGGSSINSIPGEAWMELDLRSEGSDVLERMDAEVRRALEEAVANENDRGRAGSPALSLRLEVIGDRPSGALDADAPLVRAAVAATREVGAEPELAASSTDANVPLSRGIPALTIGAGGDAGGVHTLEEWYDDRDGARGLERALLVVLAAACLE